MFECSEGWRFGGWGGEKVWKLGGESTVTFRGRRWENVDV
jgi:hypothetical protein